MYPYPNPHSEAPQMYPYPNPRSEAPLACPYPNPCRKPYAMAYVQPQCWEAVMCAGDALAHGCAFPSLVKPFLGKEACR